MVSDEGLLERMQQGDEEAFTELYRRKGGPIFRFALRMTGSHHGAEEVTQEVFLVLIQHPVHYDSRKGSFSAYLYGIARNVVLHWLQENRRKEEEDNREEGIAETNPFLDASRTETIRKLRSLILSLPASYREVLVLCDLQELSYEEAAAILKCPAGTVRSRLHRARNLLLQKAKNTRSEKGDSSYELRAL